MTGQMDPSSVQGQIAALQQAVAALTDEREIRNLILDYSFNADLGLFEEFTDLFSDDAVIDVASSKFVPVQPGKDETYYEGRAEILRFISGAGHRGVLDKHCQHHTSGNLKITLDGDTAAGFGYSFIGIMTDTGYEIASMVFRRWSFKKVDGRWRIAALTMRPTGSPDIRSLRGEL